MTVTVNTKLFPKHLRFTFVKELQETSMAIVKNIHSANECFFQTHYNKRLDLINKVLEDCGFMLRLLEICVELNYIDLRRCEHWSGLVLNVKYMSASWLKKDADRAKYLADQEERAKYEKQIALIMEVIEKMQGH
jgi:hypothetical protein